MILDCDGVLIDGEVVALTNTRTQKEIAAHQPKDGAQKTLSCARFGRGGARIIRNCPDSSLVWVLTGRRWQSPPPRVRFVTQNPDCKGGVSYPLTPETLLTFARSAGSRDRHAEGSEPARGRSCQQRTVAAREAIAAAGGTPYSVWVSSPEAAASRLAAMVAVRQGGSRAIRATRTVMAMAPPSRPMVSRA